MPYLEAGGFLGVFQIGFMQLDCHLITILVSVRDLRPTSFICLVGNGRSYYKMLQSNWGLPVDGQRLSLPWLAEQFTELPPDADVMSIQRYARAYIKLLIGGNLFTNKSNTLINWTSYTTDIMTLLHDRCHNGQVVETYVGPMIYFHIVEKHRPNHVLHAKVWYAANAIRF
ncbi:serine/threonine-protein phosphatase 7 long form-like protein [Cucumis melo var. makuwa]|uniref:Serine/threonine-protein phosphatase 7 long form-like protein n=1 Tax=Cucumis melo var. makuwa TaxID=1194695 RepID=A0A5D3D5U0_CUCMM|nr:serine/threonine-protein phosphatase 7 long form-like protein [Cucumis melo var. makuwa]TYK18927.1 serine/threonine-protein phosphatase 7 long form-like protein [Cucumis melo var. makuwa]